MKNSETPALPADRDVQSPKRRNLEIPGRDFLPPAKGAGRWAEDRSAEYLASKGLRILARNFRTKFGEIDLVASDGDTLVLVEVKHRRDETFSPVEECLTAAKRRKLLKTGRLAWLRFGPEKSVRFDYVALVGPPDGVEIRHYANVIEGPGL